MLILSSINVFGQTKVSIEEQAYLNVLAQVEQLDTLKQKLTTYEDYIYALRIENERLERIAESNLKKIDQQNLVITALEGNYYADLLYYQKRLEALKKEVEKLPRRQRKKIIKVVKELYIRPEDKRLIFALPAIVVILSVLSIKILN